MVVALVYAFDTCLDRVQLLKKYYTSRGYEVKSVTSNFSHRKKTVYDPSSDVVIPVREYHQNLSLDRILSHKQFAKGARKALRDIQPDLVHCIIPCNSLVKEMSKYKKEHGDVKIMTLLTYGLNRCRLKNIRICCLLKSGKTRAISI